jgi:putative ABC transport system ATP-binding protein
MSLIKISNIDKNYWMGEVIVRALRGVSLQIDSGEFVAIMGASGSGKSTLMNILGCLDQPTHGEYFLEDRDVSRLDKNALAGIRNSKIGFVFQNFNLLQRTSAIENVGLPLLYAGVGSKDRAATAQKLLEFVGLGDRSGHVPTQLSGGQQQRVAIARALANQPKILLADEPTGNLDSVSSRDIMQALKKLNHDNGLTIILVTHDKDVASWAHRHIVLKDGNILQDERRSSWN